MEKTWRWFGRKDKVTLEMLRQIGVEGVVTSLYDLTNGEVWNLEAVEGLKRHIESFGLRWSVVESLPVSEQIKYAGPERDLLIDSYIRSLDNLGRCGVTTVCYNFMPVIDWVRTGLEHPLPDGSTTLFFDYAKFAYFDLKILSREGAEADYDDETLAAVTELERTVTEKERQSLIDAIILKTQGFISGNFNSEEKSPIEKFRRLLVPYAGMSAETLFANLRYFIDAVMPVCDRWDIDMCIHPDDPPLKRVFGLPRVMTDADDVRRLLEANGNPHNGLTFCAGSLSAGKDNDVVGMAREFAPRTRFVHLRSCDVLPHGNFIEAPHTGGQADLVELCRIFLSEESRRGKEIPMRVDHGRNILSDRDGGYNPGYGLNGRMLAFGQVEGMLCAVENEMRNDNLKKI